MITHVGAGEVPTEFCAPLFPAPPGLVVAVNPPLASRGDQRPSLALNDIDRGWGLAITTPLRADMRFRQAIGAPLRMPFVCQTQSPLPSGRRWRKVFRLGRRQTWNNSLPHLIGIVVRPRRLPSRLVISIPLRCSHSTAGAVDEGRPVSRRRSHGAATRSELVVVPRAPLFFFPLISTARLPVRSESELVAVLKELGSPGRASPSQANGTRRSWAIWSEQVRQLLIEGRQHDRWGSLRTGRG